MFKSGLLDHFPFEPQSDKWGVHPDDFKPINAEGRATFTSKAVISL